MPICQNYFTLKRDEIEEINRRRQMIFFIGLPQKNQQIEDRKYLLSRFTFSIGIASGYFDSTGILGVVFVKTPERRNKTLV